MLRLKDYASILKWKKRWLTNPDWQPTFLANVVLWYIIGSEIRWNLKCPISSRVRLHTHLQSPWKPFNKSSYFIPHASVMFHGFFIILCHNSKFRGIFKPPVNHLCLGREERAGFMGVIAQRNDIIKFKIPQGIDILWFLPGNIDSLFGRMAEAGMAVAWKKFFVYRWEIDRI